MKLLRYGPKGLEKPGMLCRYGKIRDLSHIITDFGGETVSLRALDELHAIDPERLPEVDGEQRIGACVIDAPNFFCVGLNYSKHAAESGAQVPAEPILFSKATSALNGPNDAVVIPPGSTQTDWECELGVVIGEPCAYVSEAEALKYVAGYCVINDISERHWQRDLGGQWIKGKSAPSFGPVGPWLVTADEIENPQALSLWLELNGERVQNSSTADMIFGVAEIISYMSRFMELRPGDIIATGTPEGVGMGFDPQRYLSPGDRLRLSVEALGEQNQSVVAHSSA
ncbi:MAG: fumarylacetoacetate hydrolase family protein [Pseudomonadota bacterium]